MLPARPPSPDDHVTYHALHHAGPFRITHKSYTHAFTQPWHEHDVASIDFVLRGAGVGTYAGEEIASVAGSVEFFAAGVRHRFDSGARGIRSMHVSMPADLPRQAGIDADTLARELHSSDALGPATAILRELALPEPDALVLESLAMRLIESVGSTAPSPDRGPWLADIRDLLLEEPERATSLAAIAELVGRHPAHVAREFRRAFGLTVGEFGRRVRLSRAAQSLAGHRAPALSRTAYDHGFADQAHFTRAFRAHAGQAPGSFRRQLATPPRNG